MPVVWSERNEPNAQGWHDCTYSAVLMMLVYAGKIGYPLGIYTVEEREALERSDDRADEIGSTFFYTDQAVLRRYGVRPHRLTSDPGTTSALRDALEIPNRAYVIAGSLGHLPAGHPQRRWQPAYVGGHAICVITDGSDYVTWLDPLATWRFPGDRVPIATVAQFAWYPNDARYMTRDELAGTIPDSAMEDPMSWFADVKPVVPFVVRFDNPTNFFTEPKLAEQYKAEGSPFSAMSKTVIGRVAGTEYPAGSGNTDWDVFIGSRGGPLCYPSATRGPATQLTAPTDCSSEVADAIAPLQAQINALGEDVEQANLKIANAQKALA